jgi:hypothetical protein
MNSNPISPSAPVSESAPVARLESIANSADPRSFTTYKPTNSDRALAGAILTSHAKTFAELSHTAGISDATLERMLDDPARCAWIVSRSREGARFGRAAVYARILDMALNSRSPAWARLFLEAFDEDFKSKETIGTQNNTQVNVYKDYTTTELEAFIKQKSQQVFGGSK